MKDSSLFRRLFISIFMMLLLLFILGAFLVLHNTSRQIDADYDAQLIADGHTVWTLVREDLEEGDDLGELHLDFNAPMLNREDRDTLSHYARWRAVRIWKDNKLATQSENLQSVPLSKSKTGFSEQMTQGALWRIYTVFIPDNKITVEIWENLHNRHRLMMGITKGLLTPGIIILPLLILLLILSIRHGMKSLTLMAHQVHIRKYDDLSPITMHHLPREIRPLHTAINRLLERVAESISHERQFMDNVAHELRTPLSALRLQGELISKAPTEKQRQECIDDLITGIDRATYLFDQLLMFSRLSHHSVESIAFSPIALLQDVIAQQANIALAKNIELSLEAAKETTLQTNPTLLHIMLGALLNNALKYTPEGGAVQITLTRGQIRISDNGPGIPEADHHRVFERFTRGNSNSSITGSGLGLSIVKEICIKQHITIQLQNTKNNTGLTVILQFS